jgi:hypothetical protein
MGGSWFDFVVLSPGTFADCWPSEIEAGIGSTERFPVTSRGETILPRKEWPRRREKSFLLR